MTPRTPITGEEVADVLERAAALLEQPGKWTQKVWGSRATCMCAEGAIYAAVGASPFIGERVADWAADFFGSWLPDPAEGAGTNRIAAWNDAPGRTQAEVVAALRSAATAARQQREGK